MGKVGEGPKEFITPMTNRYCVDNKLFAIDANGKTVGYLSIDSLINGQEPFCELSDKEKEMKMEKVDKDLYIKYTENGSENYFRTIIMGKNHRGVFILSLKLRNILVFMNLMIQLKDCF